MRILMIGHVAERTGAPISLLQMAEAFQASGHGIRFGLRRGGPLEADYEQIAPCYVMRRPPFELSPQDIVRTARRYDPIMALKCQRNPERPFCLTQADCDRRGAWLKAIRKWQPDWIYVNTSHCGDLVEPLLAMNIPIVTHVREMGDVLNALDKRRQHIFLERTDLFLAASAPVRDALVALGVAPARISIEEPAMNFDRADDPASHDQSDIDAALEIMPSDRLIIGVGTVCDRKGTDLFVEACIAALKSCDQSESIQCRWFGRAEGGTLVSVLRRRVAECGLADRIKLADERPDLRPVYARADLLLMTSREDPNPRVVMEMAAAGKPTLSFDENGGAPEFIRKYRAGELVPNMNVVDMGHRAVAMLKAGPRRDVELRQRVRAGRDVHNSAERILQKARDIGQPSDGN